MITYNPAFDLYHCIFRMAHILDRLEEKECFPIDKVRIWDFYLLYPSKTYEIDVMPRKEKEVFNAREQWIERSNNPYEYSGDNRKLFEWIKPFQISALSCLVSCGILNKDAYLEGSVCVENKEALNEFMERAGGFTARERNVLSFLSLFSHHMPLTGRDGLKARTNLLESKYDAE